MYVAFSDYLLSLMCVSAQAFQLCPTLLQHHGLLPASVLYHGILQARILEWVAVSSSRGPFGPRDRTHVSYISCIDRQILYH